LDGPEGVVKGPGFNNNNPHDCTRSSSFCPFSTPSSSTSTPGVFGGRRCHPCAN
jgi:hypothetical protein